MELALQRRKRRPLHLQQKSNPDTMALTVANKDGSSRSVSGMQPPTTTIREQHANPSALVPMGDKDPNATATTTTTGILVVRKVNNRYIYLPLQYISNSVSTLTFVFLFFFFLFFIRRFPVLSLSLSFGKKHKGSSSVKIPTPTWHAPWKLSTVLSSHLGWVRSIALDPTNDMFATGSADRTIKIWDLAKASVGASDALKLTLTGHISPIRGLAFSERHPYLFSAGEDKMVKCWDLETNQVIRHYHGHLSGVFCLALHPTLDILVTGGRDAVARVWDVRSKTQIHVLAGHDHTVGSVLTKSTDPQIITGSQDTTIKLWDLAAGKCMSTLTHHQKGVRALCQPTFENTFVSGAADCLKYWQGNNGRFLKSFNGHKAIVNCLAVNPDGVLVSGGDDGSLHFWDYKTGHNFQTTTSIVQPGSLDAENGIYVAQFDGTGTRLITGEADKSIKIWKQDDDASELSHPIDMVAWRKKCLKEAKQRY